MKSFQDTLNELPEDRRNEVIQYGEELYAKYLREEFQKWHTPQKSPHDLFMFSDSGSIHVILTDTQEEFSKIRSQLNATDIDEWVNPIDECYLDGEETPRQQIERVESYYSLACEGCNIVIRTNSYFVLNKLNNLARKEPNTTGIYLLIKDTDDAWRIHDLSDGEPDNFITDTAIALYHEAMGL